MAVNSTQQGCDSFSSVNLANEGNTVPHCELPVALSDSMEVYVPLESQLPMDDQMNSQIYIKKMVESAADYSKCSEKYVDIEKGKSGSPGIKEETVGNLKNEEVQMKQISFEMGGKYMQFLMNHNLILPKFSTRGEKAVEAPRMRKYKRTASFNSRKVALMFSVLSSLGTIILIYLTLRVKQMADASIHSE
ncbi:hypothetical protein L1987_42686 [Smallanthus sonchifolius]|uniref:Uncharacterized protein n=1 Tax=Smallanthus sonchifolius TaxID=185202 RepID=A0ACB9GJM7_9ASTR|nr:hypothetical protein L1987_42686 [Smallanthus sonchifolius]